MDPKHIKVELPTKPWMAGNTTRVSLVPGLVALAPADVLNDI